MSMNEHHLQTREDKISFILDKTKNHPAGQYDAAKLMDMPDEALDQLYGWIEKENHISESESSDETYSTFEDWCDAVVSQYGPEIDYRDVVGGMIARDAQGIDCGSWNKDKSEGIVYNNPEADEIFEAVASYKTKDIKFTPTKDSSFIQGAAYDPEMETMYLKFKTGAYEYYDVPEVVYEELLKSPSMGKYFHANIRNVYTYAMCKKYDKSGRKPIRESEEYEAAVEYVDYLLGGDWEVLFDKLGMQVPQDMDATDFIPTMEKAKALGVEYFMSYPEEIEYAKIHMNEGSLNYSFWRNQAQEFIAQHAGELDRADEAKYDIGNLDYEECLNVVKELGDEDIDYLYKKLKDNSTINIDNRMNEILGLDKTKKAMNENPNIDPKDLTNDQDPTTQPGFIHEEPSEDDDTVVPTGAEDDSTDEPQGADKFNADFSDANSDDDDTNFDEPEVADDSQDIPEIIDFRNTEDGLTFTPDTEEYKALRAIHDSPDNLWDEYVQLMKDAGVNVTCDDLTDAYKVTWSDESDEDYFGDDNDEILDEPKDSVETSDDEDIKEYIQEHKGKVKARFPVEESAIKTVKKIVEGKGYNFVTLRGSLLESKQADIYELIVEKNGYKTSIVYNDATDIKPWYWNKAEFNHLQECLDTVYIPLRTLVNEDMAKEIDSDTTRQRVEQDKLNEWSRQTDKLPLEEAKRRAERGYDIYEKIVGEDLSKRGFNR